MKCFDSSSTDMNRKPMTWRKLAQRMNLNRWRRLHHCQFILLHACIARWPRPKVGREGLVGRQGRQGCQGGGMTCWWVVWSWYPGKSLEHRPNSLLILYWSLLCIKEIKKICIYKCKRLYMILKRHILYILTGYFTTGNEFWTAFPPKHKCRALAVARHLLPPRLQAPQRPFKVGERVRYWLPDYKMGGRWM